MGGPTTPEGRAKGNANLTGPRTEKGRAKANSKLRPWQPGESGNPGGKTSEQRKAEIRAGEIAAKMRLAMLEEMQAALESRDEATRRAALEFLNTETLRLFRDSEDRAYGTPKQAVELTGEDGGAVQLVTRVEIVGISADRKD